MMLISERVETGTEGMVKEAVTGNDEKRVLKV